MGCRAGTYTTYTLTNHTHNTTQPIPTSAPVHTAASNHAQQLRFANLNMVNILAKTHNITPQRAAIQLHVHTSIHTTYRHWYTLLAALTTGIYRFPYARHTSTNWMPPPSQMSHCSIQPLHHTRHTQTHTHTDKHTVTHCTPKQNHTPLQAATTYDTHLHHVHFTSTS